MTTLELTKEEFMVLERALKDYRADFEDMAIRGELMVRFTHEWLRYWREGNES